MLAAHRRRNLTLGRFCSRESTTTDTALRKPRGTVKIPVVCDFVYSHWLASVQIVTGVEIIIDIFVPEVRKMLPNNEDAIWTNRVEVFCVEV